MFKKINLLIGIEDIKSELIAISQDIHRRPELGNQEYYALARLSAFLKKEGWQVEKRIAGLPTAFVAKAGNRNGPVLAYLAEYDALPEIGHGCGHNLICTASIGAAVSLARVLTDYYAQVRVIGTPAEETTGGKIALLKYGVFSDVDAVMMFHPGTVNTIHFSSLALEALEVRYIGKGGHWAVLSNRDGDALEALLKLFYWIKNWEKTLPESTQVHGVIREGGKTPNIRPGLTAARFYLRCPDEGMLDVLVEEFSKQARRIAVETGTRVDIGSFETRYLPFRSNAALAKVFTQSLRSLNISCSPKLYRGMGSMDIGNVSHHVPAIHPFLTLQGGASMLHTAAFAEAAGTKWGDQLLVLAAKALGLTGLQFMTNENLRQRVWDEHLKKGGISKREAT